MKRLCNQIILFSIGMMSVLLTTTVVGYFGDGGKLFWKAQRQQLHLAEYSRHIVKNEIGMPRYANERHLKRAISRHCQEFDTVVIGSSRVLHLSSLRSDHVRLKFGSVLNLGVSGGTLEDLCASVNHLSENKFWEGGGKNVIFGLDPWMVWWNRDDRFHEYVDSVNAMMKRLNQERVYSTSRYTLRKYRTLFTYDYFWTSFNALFENSPGEVTGLPDYSSFNYRIEVLDTGADHELVLRDGSLLHTEKYRGVRRTSSEYKHSVSYKLLTSQPDKSALTAISGLIELLQTQDLTVSFFLSPYHHCFLSEENTVDREVIANIERIYRDIGSQYDLEIAGSYDPSKVGAKPDEFFDFMHPRPQVLDRIFAQ